MNSSVISSVYVQPLETLSYWYSNRINIFLCLFMLEQQRLFFRIISLRDEVLNHIKARGIYHKAKQLDACLGYQELYIIQVVAVIDELQVRLQIIIHSICSQDIVRLSHRMNDMICLLILGLVQHFRKAETEFSACLSFRMCFESFHVLQETNKAHKSFQVKVFYLRLLIDSFNHWRKLGMCTALIQDNHFNESLLWKDFCHQVNVHFQWMGFIEIQVVVK